MSNKISHSEVSIMGCL